MNLQEELHKIYLLGNENLFLSFVLFCAKWYNKPANSLTEIRNRDNKKIRGDIFEEFCVLYLKYVKNYDEVYLLSDVSNEMLNELSLRRQDMGIDIIVKHEGKFYAVQCKYRKHEEKITTVTWKQLSTFYALCLRTGPWEKYVVMTNANYVKREGRKTEKDLSICFAGFSGIKKDQWLKMCGVTGNILLKTIYPTIVDKEEMRRKRLEFFS